MLAVRVVASSKQMVMKLWCFLFLLPVIESRHRGSGGFTGALFRGRLRCFGGDSFVNHGHRRKAGSDSVRKQAVAFTLASGRSFSQVKRKPNVLFANGMGSSDIATGEKLSVSIIGSGAVGCYYGGRLWESGEYEVKFYMRGDHYEKSKAVGLKITSVSGDMFIPPESLNAYDSTDEMGKADWIIVALKSSSLSDAPDLIRPLLKPSTRVLAIMNGLVDDDLVAMLEAPPGESVHSGLRKAPMDSASTAPRLTCCAATYGGMALICSNRIAPGHIDHSYAGKLTVALAASAQGPSDADREAIENLWKPSNVELVYESNIVKGRWTKMVWNLPFNGISVAMGGITVDKIVTDPGLRHLADIVMDETIRAANADLESRGEDQSLFLGQAEKVEMMTLSDGMGPYKTSTKLDFDARKPMEVKYLFRKPVERAKELNVATPHLETLVTQIEAFQRIYGLF